MQLKAYQGKPRQTKPHRLESVETTTGYISTSAGDKKHAGTQTPVYGVMAYKSPNLEMERTQ